MKASYGDWQASKNQEGRIAELEAEITSLKEILSDFENYSYALHTLNIRIRDAVEELHARFADSLVRSVHPVHLIGPCPGLTNVLYIEIASKQRRRATGEQQGGKRRIGGEVSPIQREGSSSHREGR